MPRTGIFFGGALSGTLLALATAAFGVKPVLIVSVSFFLVLAISGTTLTFRIFANDPRDEAALKTIGILSALVAFMCGVGGILIALSHKLSSQFSIPITWAGALAFTALITYGLLGAVLYILVKRPYSVRVKSSVSNR